MQPSRVHRVDFLKYPGVFACFYSFFFRGTCWYVDIHLLRVASRQLVGILGYAVLFHSPLEVSKS